MTVRGRVPPRRLVRNADADDLLEGFLVAAATAFAGIRIYLALTGYPQLGGHGLHIAHLLWGGVLMLVALVMALSFLGARVRVQAAIVGGLGFGTFIDELGKFITSDNDYFYRPTVALIYAVFVLLYLSFRAIGDVGRTSPEAALARAVDLVGAALPRGLRAEDRERVLRLLDQGDPGDPLVGALRQAVRRIAPTPETGVGAPRRAGRALRGLYDRIVHDRRFLAAYAWFKRAVLVSLLLTQFSAFYENALTAAWALLLNLALLAALNWAIGCEQARGAGRTAAPPTAT